MPWIYGDEGIALMKKYFTLRTQTDPYLYTYTWLAPRVIPIVRPLYLKYPQLEEAYRHSHEYFFGDEMLVAPVLDQAASDHLSSTGSVDRFLQRQALRGRQHFYRALRRG